MTQRFLVTWRELVAWVALFGVLALVILVVPLMHRVSVQSQAGSDARAYQCALLPQTLKSKVDALNRSVITQHDYDFFITHLPTCPGVRIPPLPKR